MAETTGPADGQPLKRSFRDESQLDAKRVKTEGSPPPYNQSTITAGTMAPKVEEGTATEIIPPKVDSRDKVRGIAKVKAE